MITRRRLLLGGLAAGAALTVAGLLYEVSLDESDRAILTAIAPVMIPGADVAQVVRGTEIAIDGLPLAVRAQLDQMFGILRFGPTRVLVAGVRHPWPDASAHEVAAFLNRWRYNGAAQLRAAYDALHQLVMAGWYGNDAAWPAIGYPGPPGLAR